MILKKLRIAFELKADQLDAIFAATGEELSRHEISSFFRNPDHKHFKKCTTPLLLTFLAGIKLLNQDNESTDKED